MKKLVALVVIDGFGISDISKGNAVKNAQMPYFNYLLSKYPHCKLGASGRDVGLKDGQMGNSEVGHLNIGAGRVVCQDMTIIDNSIEDGSFYKNKVFLDCMEKVRNKDGNLHIMGLMSDGGIHSHINHLFALLRMAKQQRIRKVLIHFFSDGRDTDIHGARKFIEGIENKEKEIGLGQIATISGRFYSMDREQKYDRTKKAYDTIIRGEGRNYQSALEAIEDSYNNNVTDEFVVPCTIGNYARCYLPSANDGFIYINFRKDRTKQLTDAMTTCNFIPFKTSIQFDNFVCMTKYGDYNAKIAFEFHPVAKSLSEVISSAGLKQAKFSETTKYAHVTYFLDGGIEAPFKGEDRFKIKPKDVNTFDEAPEMSALELADKMKEEVLSGKYDFMMCNLANCDMVGHTGNYNAAIKAVETVDKALRIICEAVLKQGGELIVTADHGNAEKMLNEDGTVCTTHTTNPVHCIYVGDKQFRTMHDGRLCDIAPTILNLLGIEKPVEYTGKELLEK